MGDIAVFTVFYLSQVALVRYIETRPALFLPSFVSGRQKKTTLWFKMHPFNNHQRIHQNAKQLSDLSICLSNLEVGTSPFYKLFREWDKNGWNSQTNRTTKMGDGPGLPGYLISYLIGDEPHMRPLRPRLSDMPIGIPEQFPFSADSKQSKLTKSTMSLSWQLAPL